jgi:hypothetical protein
LPQDCENSTAADALIFGDNACPLQEEVNTPRDAGPHPNDRDMRLILNIRANPYRAMDFFSQLFTEA